MTGKSENLTHFGFSHVPVTEKAGRVAAVFDAVTDRYDIMNDLMSFGLHRLWKNFTVLQSGVRAHHRILDLAGGTGDLSARFLEGMQKQNRFPHRQPQDRGNGFVVLADINGNMLRAGRDRMIEKGQVSGIFHTEADAENLPFPARTFDCISIAFGLRNVTDKTKALQEMRRVLKPGGRVLILEFSKPVLPLLNRCYDAYSFNIIPRLGNWVCGKSDEYQYLVESIRMHPDQATLKAMMETAGFENVTWHNLTGGIVALHKGFYYG